MSARTLRIVLSTALASLAAASGAWAHGHKFVGTVISARGGHLVVKSATGSARSLSVPSDALSFLGSYSTISLAPCETVSASYQPGSHGLMLDGLMITGQVSPGCAEHDGVSSLDVGTLVKLGSSLFTLHVPGLGTVSFGHSASNKVTSGFYRGDSVLVAFTRSANGSMTASDVENAISYATGTVTSVNNATLRIRNRATGRPMRFSLDVSPSSVRVGNTVGVVYYNTRRGPVAEHLDVLH